MGQDKIFFRTVLIFAIVFGIIGFLAGNFFDFFPGSSFILLLFGGFLGMIVGVIIGTILKFKKLSSEKDKYKI
ncbi:MAG: hypothetical protein RMJ51_03825 [Candidatus Calescibacterium sp.]|nr:hypothetical protein [Candidatus Calescibacterium sp.]MCX7971748.1 hypothetical protein [bacterium]MDW8195354.1 hypothetical protein [Candidatus Calescibacterium sp.]